MSNYKDAEGKGKANATNSTNPKAPNCKGHLILDRDYSRGSKIQLSFWVYKNPTGYNLSYNINNWNPDKSQQWPKPVHEDEEVPF